MSKQKKIITAVLAASMISTFITGAVSADTEPNTDETPILSSASNSNDADEIKKGFLYGDLNGDDTADLTDLTYLSLYLLKDIQFTDNQLESADIDMSGEVDIADLAYYKQYVCKDESVISKLRVNIYKSVLVATVKEANGNKILVSPVEGSWELNSAELIYANYDSEKLSLTEGDTVEIIYDGSIMETYPAQIQSFGVRKLGKQDDPEIIYDKMELKWGGEMDLASSKPLPSNRISLKCSSFCSKGETLKVNVGIGASDASSEKDASSVHFTYTVSAVEGYNKINDDCLIINGNKSKFEKEYQADEWELINMNGKIDDYDSYYNETAEIDFKKYESDSSGCISFAFGESNDKYTSSYDGMSQELFFYAGYKGTGIGHSADEAHLEYLKAVFPEYFNLDGGKGIEVYVWQMSENSISCGLMMGTNRYKEEYEILELRAVSIEEAKLILKASGIDPNSVFVIPIQHPLSSYLVNIDSEYQKKVEDLILGDMIHENEVKYNVSVESEIDIKLASEYAAGEEITFKLPFVTDSYYYVTVNGKEISADLSVSDTDCTYFTFIMPEKDVLIEISTVDAEIPEYPQK